MRHKYLSLHCNIALSIIVALTTVNTGATHAASAVNDEPDHITFTSAAESNGKNVDLTGLWLKSALTGKQATVIALHGCGGLYSTRPGHENELSARHEAMARLLHSEGYNVLMPDSFGARGTRSICASKYGGRQITPDVRRQDVIGALRWLEQQANVDVSRVALLGWSNGGSTTLNTLNDNKASAPGPGRIKAAVAFYPGCSTYTKSRSNYALSTPLLILVGASDDWTPAAPCVELANKLAQAPLTVHVFADSYHDFDAPELPIHVRKDVPNGVHPGAGVTTGSNPVAKEAAYAEMLQFLKQQLQ